jgi:hypothetical protein
MKKRNYNIVMGILISLLIFLAALLIWIDSNNVPSKNPEKNETDIIKECLNRTEITLYGKKDSLVFIAQKEELGELFEAIPFVDCLREKEKCEGVLLIPAWRLKGNLYYGSFSRDVLIRLTGCESGLQNKIKS